MSVRAPRLRESFEAFAIAAGGARVANERVAKAKAEFDGALVDRARYLGAMQEARREFDAAVNEFALMDPVEGGG